MKRRDFLKLTAGLSIVPGAMTSLLSGCEDPAGGPIIDRSKPVALRIPSLIAGGSITAAYGTTEIWEGASTNVLTLNGGYLGPTIVRNRGEQFALNFVNQLGEASIIHWHGLNIPANMDGHPAEAITAGTFNYTFAIDQRAGTYWYHAHPDMLTAKQAYMGFAGVFIVQDPEEQSLALPRGDHDVPLVLQDKRTSSRDTQVPYDRSKNDVISGFLGNEVFVNGTPNAFLDVESGIYRLRILNGSNARVYRLAFSDDRTFHVIATDGGLLDKPYEVTEITLSPGERAEILCNFNDTEIGTSVSLLSKQFAVSGSHSGSLYHQGEPLQIIAFNIRAQGDQELIIPASLVALERLSEANAKRERIFTLTMDHSRSSGIHKIDGKIFDMHRSDYQIPFDELEVWEIQNQAEGLHSMHIHGTQFQVLERRFAGPMTPVDYGWKDTVLVNDNETVRLLVRFKDHRGRYLFHCHFLEHEDDGMMVNVDVV
jgi:FtsP/CotA-like multicopper oxidase with cupredoxin domain